MVATRRRFASDGERRLYPALVKVYGAYSVQGHVGMGGVVASKGMGLTDAYCAWCVYQDGEDCTNLASPICGRS